MMRALLSLMLGFVAATAASQVHGAQGYPTRPIRVVVAYAPGGGSDMMARLITQTLTQAFNESAVVDYRPGAGGRVGTLSVARSAPDGYTLLMTGTGAIIMAVALYGEKLPYDPQKDLAPITTVASSLYVLVVHPTVPVRSVRELIALAKSRPGMLNYASSGVGAPAHLAAELFRATAKVSMAHVAYKGTSPGMMSVVTGETDLMFSNILPAVPSIQSGRLRAVAVTSLKRSPVFPDVPTVAESGLLGFETVTYYGLYAPAGTPPDIVTQINAAVVKGLQSPEMRKRLEADGSVLHTSTPQEFARLIRSDTEKWLRLVKTAGIKPE
ncbi:MAG: tripartite tricarboxylate transporter substrate binding protein [Betaproteobacteria bacterium]|nr:tripartite tricarboxylate transporter substrate binding protein [Betaproteobacteria bacterium]